MFKPRDKRNDVPTKVSHFHTNGSPRTATDAKRKTAAAPVPHESRLAQPKRTFEDWLAMGKDDGDAYGFSAQQQRERAGRKNKKQKKNLHIEMEARSDWSAGFVLSSTNIRGKRGEKFKTTAEFDERRSAWRTALGRPAQSRRPIDQDSSTRLSFVACILSLKLTLRQIRQAFKGSRRRNSMTRTRRTRLTLAALLPEQRSCQLMQPGRMPIFVAWPCRREAINLLPSLLLR